MKITINADLAKRITFEDIDDQDGLEIIESDGDWIQMETVFKMNDKFYSLNVSRSGSPFSDWHYDWEDSNTFDCPEVEKVEVIKYVWKVIK